ncbi:MAG: GNAT family N-acetyltransferase [Vulcanimicrobiaceae bacterium]
MTTDHLSIFALRSQDRERWEQLWHGYLAFYGTSLPQDVYDATWRKILAPDGAIRGFAAGSLDGPEGVLGIVHYFFHQSAWTTGDVCYLQDLFVDSNARGRGFGRRLIEAVAAEASRRGCFRLYWHTKESNGTARALYDAVAKFNGFIRYEYPLVSVEEKP